MDAVTFTTPPDPAAAGSIDDLVERLRRLKVWAGDPSYEIIKDRVNAGWTAAGRPASELTIKSTVAHCFQPGRRRLNTDLVLAVVEALHPDTGYVARWRQALRLIGGEIEAVSQVRVQDTLPRDPAGFTGRAGELERLRRGPLSAIEGMAGVGKTQLAVHAGHQLVRAKAVDRVLFVNLRGFHPDPGQPPADPAAVLDGFLRLLGMPGHQIPHDPAARAAAYRERLTGTRTLVVLDNAATADQVRPLLPGTPGCRTLVTSRRSLALPQADHLSVDVFTPDEAVAFLALDDPGAAARIARRCGYLPLALSLIAGHIRNTPGWTAADHADRLDERHRDRRLDSGVELALDLSYRHLTAGQQRLLRLTALHPGQDFDAYAAAALTDNSDISGLVRDHLLQQTSPGRYTFHDLVRAYATSRAHDEDRPADRRAALTRLFDHYLATAAAAMTALHPAEAHRRPHIPPAATPAPDLTDPDAALAWLDAERPTLVAVAAHTATNGWPGHTTRLAHTVSRYLNGGHYTDALVIHGHAHHAARRGGDVAEQAHAMRNLGVAHLRLGRLDPAADHLRQALDLFRHTGDPTGQADALFNLGILTRRSGRFPEAIDFLRQALDLYRQAGDRTGEAHTLIGLGIATEQSGRFPEATDHYGEALTLARHTGHREGEAFALHNLGDAERKSGRYGPAGDHLRQALALYRQLGNRSGEGGALDSLGMLHTLLGEPGPATDYHHQALAIVREVGEQDPEAWVLNGLGEAALADGRAADAVTHHTAAHAIATRLRAREQQARAGTGLGRAHAALGDRAAARGHYEQALAVYAELGVPDADRVRALLGELG